MPIFREVVSQGQIPAIRRGTIRAKATVAGGQDSNPQPSVLETAALPIELHPCHEGNSPFWQEPVAGIFATATSCPVACGGVVS